MKKIIYISIIAACFLFISMSAIVSSGRIHDEEAAVSEAETAEIESNGTNDVSGDVLNDEAHMVSDKIPLSSMVTADEYANAESVDLGKLIFDTGYEYETGNKRKEENEDDEAVFKSEILPESIVKKISGNSWKAQCPVSLADLRYLTLTYLGYDGESRQGEMIVHKIVAEDVLEIFKGLYQDGFQIERMQLVDEYGGDDDLSMAANNTSAFNFRNVAGSERLSMHAYGLAIDINPVMNPYSVGGKVYPDEGKKYLNRSEPGKGLIRKNDSVYDGFIQKGWTWGGDWYNSKDYQHFENKALLNKIK